MSIEKRGNVWRVRWRDAQGRPHTKTVGPRKRDAIALDAKLKRDKALGDTGLLEVGTETFAAFTEEWRALYADVHLAARSRRSYYSVLERVLLPQWGRWQLRHITGIEIERWLSRLECGPSAKRQTYKLLRGMLARAVEWEHLDRNPAERVRVPAVRRDRVIRVLAPAEVEELRGKLSPRDATIVSVLAYAGLRPSEAVALRWSDLNHPQLLVERAANDGNVKATKTGRVRRVRVMEPLAEDLWAWAPQSKGEAMFPASSGDWWKDWEIVSLRQRVMNAGGPTLYDLRHSFVSLLIHEGRSVIDVAKQAGHSPSMTLDVYGHIFDALDPTNRVDAETLIRQARETTERNGRSEDGA